MQFRAYRQQHRYGICVRQSEESESTHRIMLAVAGPERGSGYYNRCRYERVPEFEAVALPIAMEEFAGFAAGFRVNGNAGQCPK